jgi:hypothetical protein
LEASVIGTAPLSRLANPASLDAPHINHNARGRDSTHPSRDSSLLYLCTIQALRIMPGVGVVQATGHGVEEA